MTTKTLTTTIRGIEVELDLYMEGGEQRSDCSLNHGDFSGSLECLLQTGGLEDSIGAERQYPQSTIDAVEAWATKNGY